MQIEGWQIPSYLEDTFVETKMNVRHIQIHTYTWIFVKGKHKHTNHAQRHRY